MSNNSLVTSTFFNTSNDGSKFSHNFINRYLDDQTLAKPSAAIGNAIAEVTKKDIMKITGIKTSVGHVHFTLLELINSS